MSITAPFHSVPNALGGALDATQENEKALKGSQ
jgi:hypothetical protein